MSNFIDEYINYTNIYESSTAFWKWSAYATIAGILRDNCYKRLGDLHIYPNIYVLLLAPSAQHRKGNPVNLCEKLSLAIRNTKIISGRTSIQAVLDELATGQTDQATGKVMAGGSALWIAPELSAGIVNDPEAVKILTDIYDFKHEYTSRLRGSGTFKIKNVCFSMLAASNEDLLRDIYDTKAIFGGLLGRTFLVKPDEFRESRSLFHSTTDLNGDNRPKLEDIIQLLNELSCLHGEFHFHDSAIKEFESWYIPFRRSHKDKSDKAGVAGRIHTSIVKLSMIIAVNYQKNLEVTCEHMERAIYEANQLMPNYQEFIMASGKSTISELGTLVLTAMYGAENHMLSRSKILSRFLLQITSEQLDELMETLMQAKMVDPMQTDDGVSYKLTQKCIDKLYGG